MDLGDYKESMEVGTSQVVSVLVIPSSATNQSITYSSSNTHVATINGIGRITANSVGKTKITIKLGSIKKIFVLTVTNKIVVEDIEVGEYKEEMDVDTTQTISATVLPTTLTEQIVTYASSNNAIATINSSGCIKALSKGNVKILLTVGDYKKELDLHVMVATKYIEVNKSYIVLKPGEQFQLKSRALPSDANQTMRYNADNSGVASVSIDGLITAKKEGTAYIFISNGDGQQAVTVIVNRESQVNQISDSEKNQIQETVSTNNLVNRIKDGPNEKIFYDCTQNEFLTVEVLKALYESKKTFYIDCGEYSLILCGKDIVNYENILEINIQLGRESEGISFILNDYKNLPGKVTIQLKEEKLDKKSYLYLYNTKKNVYEMLNTQLNGKNIEIDIAGKYMLTEKKINSIAINWVLIGIGGAVLFGLCTWYILVKKKHWFW